MDFVFGGLLLLALVAFLVGLAWFVAVNAPEHAPSKHERRVIRIPR
jgi:hypothetical protein